MYSLNPIGIDATLIIQEHISSPSVFSGVRDLNFLSVLLSVILWALYCLSLDLWLLIASFVSSNLCKIVRSSVILLLPLFIVSSNLCKIVRSAVILLLPLFIVSSNL